MLLLAGCQPEEAQQKAAGAAAAAHRATGQQVNRFLKSGPLKLSAGYRARETASAKAQPPGETPLARFHAALHDLAEGRRTRPVTILHLGDSHIAADRFTGDLRDLFQRRFGDAGRGLMMPGYPFPWYRARGVVFSKSGDWTAASSLDGAPGPYGLAGVRLTAAGADARLSLRSENGSFEWAEVTFLSAADGGGATVTAGQTRKEVSTRGAPGAAERVLIRNKGKSLAIRTRGDGPVTVLSWAVGNDRPGVRYVNLGIPGATAEIVTRWEQALVAADMERLSPDLIVLGYGTNEGFDDDLDLNAYQARVTATLARLAALAPGASLAVIAPPDGARLPKFAKGKGGREALLETPCAALSAQEIHDYARLRAARDPSLGRWHAPPNLAGVRSALKQAAAKLGAHYWNWSQAMGGTCSIHDWARAEPPRAAADHVHLTAKGAEDSARAFFASLMDGFEASGKVAGRKAPAGG